MLVTEEHIEELIPQKRPFLMISNLLSASDKMFEGELIVRENNIFMKNGILQEAALIESIAQTCAAGFGYLNNKAGRPPMLGFIGAITKLKVYSLPKVNATVSSRITVMHQLENVFLVKGQSSYLGKELLECELKIVLT